MMIKSKKEKKKCCKNPVTEAANISDTKNNIEVYRKFSTEILSFVKNYNSLANKIIPIFSTFKNGWNIETLVNKTKKYTSTIIIVKTNYNKIIGFYMP